MDKKNSVKEVIHLLQDFLKYERKTTLNREGKDNKTFTPYQTLISCLLSLRAKDEVTEVISKELFKIAPTPEKILELPIDKLKNIIFSSGHYNKKAEAIRHVSKEILEKYNGEVPDSFEELIKIKHIGPKTANIVLCFSFNKEVIPVDTHVQRIPNRLGWVKTKKPEETEKELMKILPKEYWSIINGLFVLFGKKVCLPVSPLCSSCPVRDICMKVGVERSR